MGPGVVLVAESVQERVKVVGISPGVGSEPLFERADKALGNPVGLRPVTRHKHMNEVMLVGEAPKVASGEVRAAVGDEELEVGRKQGA